ncbi:unnamed protein product, partial [Polarella glacialis]
ESVAPLLGDSDSKHSDNKSSNKGRNNNHKGRNNTNDNINNKNNNNDNDNDNDASPIPRLSSGCSWGGGSWKHHPQVAHAQVAAAATILLPWIVSLALVQDSGCLDLVALGSQPDARKSIWEPVSGVVLAFTVVVPGSVANHLAHAIVGHYVSPFQKLDRAGILLSAAIGCWSLSQSVAFAMAGSSMALAIFLAMLVGPEAIRDNCDLITMGVGGLVIFNLSGCFICRDRWDPDALPALGSICLGFVVFGLEMFGVWTDAVWHFAITVYAYFVTQSCISLQRQLIGGC